jgi:transmembrane sensor
MNATMPDDAELERMEQAADWLIRLNEAAGDEAAITQWLQWCERDDRNLTAFQRAQSVWQAAIPRGAAHRTHALFAPRRLAIAASLLCAVGAALWFGVARLPEPAVQSYSTPIAGRGTSVLPDGSRVELGASSRMSTHYSAAQRGVTVDSGEAYFTVAKDPSRPFIVTAGSVRITAVGTAFNVRRGDDRVVITVSEGRVRLTGSGAAAADSALEAGQQAVYVPVAKALAIAPVHTADAASWRQGVLKYIHEPLSAVTADLNRYSAKRIVLTDPRLATLPFTGTVFSARIGDALHGFADVFPLQVIERPDRIELAAK